MSRAAVKTWVPALMVGIPLIVAVSSACEEPPGGPQFHQPGFAGSPFPSETARGVMWFDSLAEGIEAAMENRRPVCLIIAGQRQSGGC